jgi:hypothetical protein
MRALIAKLAKMARSIESIWGVRCSVMVFSLTAAYAKKVKNREEAASGVDLRRSFC